MDLFKGKTPSERNKLIAAIVLGVLAVFALAFAFGPGLFSTSTATNVTVNGSPKPGNSPSKAPDQFQMPSRENQNWEYSTIPVAYSRSDYYAPDPGRNIFQFREPPPCYPNCPTPFVPPKTPPPTPAPTPFPYQIAMVMPQTVYAGQRSFRLELAGDGFEPDSKIYFNQALMPTTFVSSQRMTTEVPANMIASEGPKQIIVQSASDASKYSEQRLLMVQPPPKPQYEYVGMISRKFANNDTAYFIEKNKMNTPNVVPTGKRLNDILGGRFRLVSISDAQTIFEDVNLGFRHSLPLNKGSGASGPSSSPGSPAGFPGFNPTRPGNVPGFPNVTMPQPPRPSNANRPVETRKNDGDDDDDPNN